MKLFTKKFYGFMFLFLFLSSSFVVSQNRPYLSVPVNGSNWEMVTPTLYWWYVPTPYSAGPFNYHVEVSQSSVDFSSSNLVVDQNVTSGGVGYYAMPSSAGLIPGVIYYWRVGVNGNYSDVWSFSPYNNGTVTYYTIDATANPNGSITPSGSISVARGSSKSFNISPNSGFVISGLNVDGTPVTPAGTYSFSNITSDHIITASFTAIPIFDTTFVNYLTGSDTDGDGTRVHPYKKIQRGIDRTEAGGLVYVFNGNYEQDIVITKPITVLGQANPSLYSNPSTRSFIVQANDVTIKNFQVTQSSPGPGIQKVGFESYYYLKNLALENIYISNNAEMGLLLENMDSITVKNCNFDSNDMGGITMINCNHIFLEDIGMQDNLRGYSAYNCTDINIQRLSAIDNGKPYIANDPDKNGMTFTLCRNINLSNIISNGNAEQGIKFEECAGINLGNISASHNLTDGIAIAKCDHVVLNDGTVSNNGQTTDDNGVEFVACNDLQVTNLTTNKNFNKGILFDYFYKGVYEWNPATNTPTVSSLTYLGPSTYVTMTNITANENGNDGMYGIQLTHFTASNLNLNQNGRAGLWLNTAHYISLIGGRLDGNQFGLVLSPIDNSGDGHPHAANLATDEIKSFALTGEVTLSGNTQYGILLTPGAGIQITDPLIYGKIKVEENGIAGVKIYGNVLRPVFGGLFFKPIAAPGSAGLVIADFDVNNQVEGTKISNSYFNGFPTANSIVTAAITLYDRITTKTAANNVDAQNNAFVGANNLTDVENMIVDGGSMGIVDVTDWTNGQPSINIGTASGYSSSDHANGSLVTIPVVVNISATPLSFSYLEGKFYFNELHLSYQYATYGTGTFLHDADWVILFNHSTAGVLGFKALGNNAINSTGVLLYLTFKVIDTNPGSVSEPITGVTGEWSTGAGSFPFVVNNGAINYTSNTGTSLVKGDATMDFTVNNDDVQRILNHVNGTLLTGQAFLNADVNKDSQVDELDAADVLAFINNGSWPNTSAIGICNLTLTTGIIDQQGIYRFPISMTNLSNVRSIQVELKYDDSKLNFRNYRQLLQNGKVVVTAEKVSNGVTRMLFTSSDNTSGNVVPAEVMFNVTGDASSAVIKSAYSVNGGAFQTGPDYGKLSATAVETEDNSLPKIFEVYQNYPNPFNPSTLIRFSIPEAGFVTVKIFDILGRNINTLINSEFKAGVYTVRWNGENSFGSKVASGTYFYQVKTGSNVSTKKMLLIK